VRCARPAAVDSEIRIQKVSFVFRKIPQKFERFDLNIRSNRSCAV
jgi:hypothetical protein